MKFRKSLPILLAMSLLFIGGIEFLFVSNSHVDECEGVFSSNTYTSYHQQLHHLVTGHPFYSELIAGESTPFNIKVRGLIGVIETSLASPGQQRELHENFVMLLREAIQLSNVKNFLSEDRNAREFLDDLVGWVYLHIDLNSVIKKNIYSYIKPPGKELFSYLLTNQVLLHEDKRLDGLHYELDVDDGYLHGNLPSVYFVIPNPQATKVIRSGKPFRHSLKFPWETPELTPEFLKFLRNHQGHLYVNLLKRTGVEGKATSKIEGLEASLPGMYAITLDKNSDFYTQESQKFFDLNDSELFKLTFLERMMAKNGNYYWSVHLMPDLWSEELKGILEIVHEKYFFSKLNLDISERKDFIELAYLEILDTLVKKWEPPSVNITCNQGIDRGPSLLVLWMIKNQKMENEEIAGLLLGPPLLFHNRSSHAARIERFVSSAKRLEASAL